MVLASSQVKGQRVVFGVSSLKLNTASDPVLATPTRDTSALPLVSAPTTWVQYPTKAGNCPFGTGRGGEPPVPRSLEAAATAPRESQG